MRTMMMKITVMNAKCLMKYNRNFKRALSIGFTTKILETMNQNSKTKKEILKNYSGNQTMTFGTMTKVK